MKKIILVNFLLWSLMLFGATQNITATLVVNDIKDDLTLTIDDKNLSSIEFPIIQGGTFETEETRVSMSSTNNAVARVRVPKTITLTNSKQGAVDIVADIKNTGWVDCVEDATDPNYYIISTETAIGDGTSQIKNPVFYTKIINKTPLSGNEVGGHYIGSITLTAALN